MKRSKTSAKSSSNQRTISSFFTITSSPAGSREDANVSCSSKKTTRSIVESVHSDVSCTPKRKSAFKDDNSSSKSKTCTPTKKRKKEDIKWKESLDIVAATPSEFKVHSPLRTQRIDTDPVQMTKISELSHGDQGFLSNEPNNQSSKVLISPKKVIFSLAHLKSSPNQKTNISKAGCDEKINITKANCDKSDKSRKTVISPIKAEEDEVLKSILEHLSPQGTKTKKLSHSTNTFSARKKTLFPSASALSPKKGPQGEKELQSNSKRVDKRVLMSPVRSEMTELKYPALQFAPKNPVTKNVEGGISPLKHTAKKTSPTKATFPLPERRSPRKHPLPIVIQKEEKEAENKKQEKQCHLKLGKDTLSVGQENKAMSLRRSPRKHPSPTDHLKSPTKCMPRNKMDTVTNNLDDLHAVFNEDDDEMLSYMSSLNDGDASFFDLHEAQLCEVISIVIEIPFKEALMKVKKFGSECKALCRVRGCWLASPVIEGDAVGLQAEKVDGEWLLDNLHGLLVLHPDTLISGTTVVGSLFCARRSVLSSLFRGMDSDSPIMVTGSIIHELFQMVLKEGKQSEAEIRELADQLISSKNCVRMLYSAKMSVAQIQKELSSFVPRIIDFVSKFIEPRREKTNGKKSAWLEAPSVSTPKNGHISIARKHSHSSKEWNGKIVGIRDIEETLWDPKLGIKGMVDVSVDVRDYEGNQKIMPLELKTGRASFSAEHRGQVTLYTMMMSRMGINVESGLLLYLREGQMQEISVSHNERKDLIQLRNTLAHYLKPRVPILLEETNQFAPPRLPDPINFKSACEKCPYGNLCSIYLKRDGLAQLSEGHPMVSISASFTQHLTEKHVDYLMHWVGLLLLESTAQLSSSKFRHIWRHTPSERESGKRAIVNLQLMNTVENIEGKFIHTFTRKMSSCTQVLVNDLREAGLSTGDYILISTDTRLAIERGNIVDIDEKNVKVSTNRNLYIRYSHDTFHLDASESDTVLVFNLTNLGCLMDDNESAERLRAIVIDKSIPTFSCKVEKNVIQDCLPIFSKLNKNQRKALVKTLKADSHILIKGLPGTGKTATMVALVRVLVRAGLTVLVTSHTHSAVDNLLLRLKKEGLKFLRLGSDERIHPHLIPFSESSLTKHCKTPEELDKVYNCQQIVGVTCLGAGHASLSQRRSFDVCLVDESTQVLQPSILRPLFSARRFVLVGDPEQLPPVVKCHQAQKLGLSESLFARLDSETATVSLTLNYRMNRAITDLANGLTYEGKLLCGNEDVANATLKISSPMCSEKIWLSQSLSSDIDKSVVFVDTSASSRNLKDESRDKADEEMSCSNHFELHIVQELLNAFLDSGMDAGNIGVMAPYRAQVALLIQAIKLDPKLAGVEVNTVDQFQGRDKEVIIYSCTRSDGASNEQKPKDREILNDQRRLTVAVTRAKLKLILIGHSVTLKLYKPFQKLLSCISSSNIVPVHS